MYFSFLLICYLLYSKIVHGHTHSEFDYMIGETRVICHPRGYPRENPWYSDYQPKIIEV